MMTDYQVKSLQEIYKLVEQLEQEQEDELFDHRITFLKAFIKGLIDYSALPVGS